MAIFLIDRKAVTLTIHKDGCAKITPENRRACGCSEPAAQADQWWYCEEHIKTARVQALMEGQFWSIILCETCFGKS